MEADIKKEFPLIDYLVSLALQERCVLRSNTTTNSAYQNSRQSYTISYMPQCLRQIRVSVWWCAHFMVVEGSFLLNFFTLLLFFDSILKANYFQLGDKTKYIFFKYEYCDIYAWRVWWGGITYICTQYFFFFLFVCSVIAKVEDRKPETLKIGGIFHTPQFIHRYHIGMLDFFFFLNRKKDKIVLCTEIRNVFSLRFLNQVDIFMFLEKLL